MRIAAALLVLVAASPCSAQDAPVSLPVALVSALFSGAQAPGRGSIYTVGEPPAGWPMELWPVGGAAIGGMTEGRTLIAIFADTSTRPLANYLTLLRNAGFTQPTMRGGNGFTSSGGPFSWYCRDSTVVTARMAPAPAGRSYLRVSYAPGSRTSCVVTESSFPKSASRLELPSLPPPPGVNAGRAGASASDDGVSSETTLPGASIAPSALVAHYARLLTAAGWTTTGVTSDSTAAAQLLRAHDATGRAWQGVLSAFATPTGRNVVLSMYAEDGR